MAGDTKPRALWRAALFLGLSACCQAPGSCAGKPAPPPSVEAPLPSATASAPAPVLLGADGLPRHIPSTRTPAPTADEWEKAPRIRVASALANRCEVNMVREWVRVDCSGARRSGGTPSGVEARAGCPRDTYTSMRSHANLVTGLVRGQRCEVEFSWTDGKELFVADWSGRERPTLAFQPSTGAPPSATATAPGRLPLRIGPRPK